ncbi:hypothetical protein LS71_008885 [Helicobacter jaachi]|uniref:Uncharacterized protein n=1 Tax=Helicobacter jaachi TaxID=1677920 RepID=A0A4U8T5T1_9HELI|nr:hypothetical protein [Helicobacter jaachi]TLD94926.1 hypothetical protein LS71_008885 [Helicobacter jaachi]
METTKNEVKSDFALFLKSTRVALSEYELKLLLKFIAHAQSELCEELLFDLCTFSAKKITFVDVCAILRKLLLKKAQIKAARAQIVGAKNLSAYEEGYILEQFFYKKLLLEHDIQWLE